MIASLSSLLSLFTAPKVSQTLYTSRNAVDMLPFTYPELKQTGDDWYVWFKVINPATGKMERRRVRINHIKNVKNRLKSAKILVRKISEQLEEGWNPFITQSNTTFKYINIINALDEVMALKQAFVRSETFKTYKVRIRIFKQWLHQHRLDKIYSNEFRADDAMKFMDYILVTRKASKRGYNNYLLDLTTFFNEMHRRNYVLDNPFKKINRMDVDEKIRESFTLHELKALSKHLLKHDFDFYIIFQYTYMCGLRPSEIARTTVGDVDLRKGTIRISGDSAKTHKTRTVPIISTHFIDILREYLKPFPPSHYLVSSEGRALQRNSPIRPGATPIRGITITKKFIRIAARLKLRKGITFYSGKDTIAGTLIDLGEDITLIQKFLGHHNLTSTQAYISKRKPVVSEKAKGLRF